MGIAWGTATSILDRLHIETWENENTVVASIFIPFRDPPFIYRSLARYKVQGSIGSLTSSLEVLEYEHVISHSTTWMSSLLECKDRFLEIISDKYPHNFLSFRVYLEGNPIILGEKGSDGLRRAELLHPLLMENDFLSFKGTPEELVLQLFIDGTRESLRKEGIYMEEDFEIAPRIRRLRLYDAESDPEGLVRKFIGTFVVSRKRDWDLEIPLSKGNLLYRRPISGSVGLIGFDDEARKKLLCTDMDGNSPHVHFFDRNHLVAIAIDETSRNVDMLRSCDVQVIFDDCLVTQLHEVMKLEQRR